MSTFSNRVLVLAVLSALALTACQRQPRPPALVVEAENEPDQETWGVDLIMNEADKPRVRIDAAYMARYETEDSTYARLEGTPGEAQVVVTIYDADGFENATVTADRVRFLEEDRRFTANGKVVVITTSGNRLETEELRWRAEDQRVHAPGFVRLETPDQVFQGYNLTGDETLDTFQFRRLSGQFAVEEDL